MNPDFIQPQYDRSGFASLPSRLEESLQPPDPYQAVVLLLVDGFGWRFFEQFQDAPFFKQVLRRGRVEKLTSQFPSTTAAHLTTLHTGLPVGKHGIFEWYYYEPGLDAVIAPLLFSFAGTPQRDTLKPAGIKPAAIYPASTRYRLLKRQGISSTIFQSREYTPSTYSNAFQAAARTVTYRSLPSALVTLAQTILSAITPSINILYFDRVDGIAHEFGPQSPQVEAEITSLLLTLKEVFLPAMQNCGSRVLFLLSADHGMAETDPQTTIFLNKDRRFSGLERFLRRDNHGDLIVPAGSPRDFFLYIIPGMESEARDFLSSKLEGVADVLPVAQLASQGWFGPQPSPRFLARAGDLVILPYRYESVWWYERKHFEQNYYGHHGGLTPQEMEIPLVSWEL